MQVSSSAGSKRAAIARQLQGWAAQELAACSEGWGSSNRALLGDKFSLEVMWVGGTDSGTSAPSQGSPYSDIQALHEGAATPGFFLFTIFSDNQSLTRAGAETPGGMNSSYKGPKQSHCLDTLFMDQLRFTSITRMLLVGWLEIF